MIFDLSAQFDKLIPSKAIINELFVYELELQNHDEQKNYMNIRMYHISIHDITKMLTISEKLNKDLTNSNCLQDTSIS